jgi:hypothetical protein
VTVHRNPYLRMLAKEEEEAQKARDAAAVGLGEAVPDAQRRGPWLTDPRAAVAALAAPGGASSEASAPRIAPAAVPASAEGGVAGTEKSAAGGLDVRKRKAQALDDFDAW